MRISDLMVVGLVVLLMLSSGCAGPQTLSAPSATEVRQQSLKAVDDVKLYKFSMDLGIDIKSADPLDPVDLDLSVDGTGELDLAAKKSKLKLHMINPNLKELGGESEANTTLYFVNDTVYVLVFETWLKQRMENIDDVWMRQNQLKQQMQLLSESDLTLLDDDEINGEPTFVLQAKPDARKAVKYLTEQQGAGNLGSLSEEQLDEMSAFIKEYEMTQWIRKSDYLPLKFNTVISMASENSTVDMNMEMRFWDYGVPNTIEPPLDATEVPVQ